MTSIDTPTSSRAPWSGQSGWHVADWGPWGWVETVLKSIAIVVAIGAAIDDGALARPDPGRLTYWILLVIAAGYIVTIFDRLTDREVVAMAFVVLMVIGHWAMVYAMGRADWPAGPVRAFAGLMAAGDVVKLGYFATTRTSVRGIPWFVPFALTSILVVGYLVAIVAA